jgi:hypothetical protein
VFKITSSTSVACSGRIACRLSIKDRQPCRNEERRPRATKALQRDREEETERCEQHDVPDQLSCFRVLESGRELCPDRAERHEVHVAEEPVEPPPTCFDRIGKMLSARIHPTAPINAQRATTVGPDVPRARPMTTTTIMAAPPTMTSTLALSIDEA